MKKFAIWALAAVATAAFLSPALRAKTSTKTQMAQNMNIFNAICRELYSSYVDSLDAKIAQRYKDEATQIKCSLRNDLDIDAALKILGDCKAYDTTLPPLNPNFVIHKTIFH